jgi:two-component system response regulator YesN
MYRLLIIDDEPFIVNGLVNMVEEASDLEVEVYKAYSAFEALEWFDRVKIDIVLSDISMPAMDGLALQRTIHERWPGCKLIFLTGYDEFAYAKEALRHQAVDYILKTEGDEAIRAAIRKAMLALDRELEINDLVAKAESQIRSALPLLRRDFLRDVLLNGPGSVSGLHRHFQELEIGLDPSAPVLMVLGRVDGWKEEMDRADETLLLFAVQNVGEELLAAPFHRLVSFPFDRKRMVWLIQTEDDEQRAIRYVQGTLERIQTVCRDLLKLNLSLSAASEFAAWERLDRKFERLKLTFGMAMGQELLLTDESVLGLSAERGPDIDVRLLLKKTDVLEELLENGTREIFRRTYAQHMQELYPFSDRPNVKLTLCLKLSSIFLSYLTKEGLWERLRSTDRFNPLNGISFDQTWDQLVETYGLLADWIFEQKSADMTVHQKKVVHLIHRHIEQHLAEDLSLTRLGEITHLNPVYLSRVYKQCTGENLTDAILKRRIFRAKELLSATNKKIQDIACEVGFDSASYFTRCFKKIMGITP